MCFGIEHRGESGLQGAPETRFARRSPLSLSLSFGFKCHAAWTRTSACCDLIIFYDQAHTKHLAVA
jgi:hypothetical protein